MPTRIVAISHASGSGGDAIGRAVAARLSFRYVDEEIITLAAGKHGVDAAAVADVERRKGLLARLVDSLSEGPVLDASASAAVLVPDAVRMVKGDDLRALIVDAIRETAERGGVVIVSHAASIPLAGRKDLLRVLVTASFDTRVERVAASHSRAESDAAKFVKHSDAARAEYFERFYGIDQELPTHYDIVVNTDALDLDEATDIVASAALRRA